MVNIQGKSLLGLQGVPREEIELILRVAKKMKPSSRVTIRNCPCSKASRWSTCFGNRVPVPEVLLKWRPSISVPMSSILRPEEVPFKKGKASATPS